MIDKPTGKTINSIQVLRGIASLLVVLFHADINAKIVFGEDFLGGFFHFAEAGVDVFFVLSGFIITYTNQHALGHKEKLPGFLLKRFIRIYPVYWLTISFFLLIQVLAPSYYNSQYPLEGATLVSTYLLITGHIMINGVSWSLTNEVFFYILFSLGFFIKSRKWAGYLLLAITGFLLVYHFLGLNPGSNRWIFLLLFAMNIEFAMGVFAAALFKYVPGKYGPVLMISSALLFFFCGVLRNKGIGITGSDIDRVIYFGLPSFLFVLGAVAYEMQGGFARTNRRLLQLGDASYSLYLVHLPLLVAGFKLLQLQGVSGTIVINLIILAIVIALCIASILFYKIIEKPLTRWLNSVLLPARKPKI